jgi:hypothetical protein
MSGTGTLINVNSGRDATYDAIALSELTTLSFYRDPGAAGADFNSPEVTPVSVVLADAQSASGFGSGSQGYLLRSNWTRGVDAVSAVLSKAAIVNEFILDNGTRSTTDWIITAPTASYYTAGSAAIPPFSTSFGATGACERLGTNIYSREQRRVQGPCTAYNFDDCPVPEPLPTACWAASAVPWRLTATPFAPVERSSALGSSNLAAKTFTGMVTVQNGWAEVRLDTVDSHAMTSLPSSTAIDIQTGQVSTSPHKFFGLPSVGFAIRTFANGTLICGGQPCQGNYGSIFAHRYRQRIAPGP